MNNPGPSQGKKRRGAKVTNSVQSKSRKGDEETSFALVFWVASNNTSIIDLKKDVDKPLSNDEIKIGASIEAYWGQGRGRKLYTCTVLFLDDSVEVLKAREVIYLKEYNRKQLSMKQNKSEGLEAKKTSKLTKISHIEVDDEEIKTSSKLLFNVVDNTTEDNAFMQQVETAVSTQDTDPLHISEDEGLSDDPGTESNKPMDDSAAHQLQSSYDDVRDKITKFTALLRAEITTLDNSLKKKTMLNFLSSVEEHINVLTSKNFPLGSTLTVSEKDITFLKALVAALEKKVARSDEQDGEYCSDESDGETNSLSRYSKPAAKDMFKPAPGKTTLGKGNSGVYISLSRLNYISTMCDRKPSTAVSLVLDHFFNDLELGISSAKGLRSTSALPSKFLAALVDYVQTVCVNIFDKKLKTSRAITSSDVHVLVNRRCGHIREKTGVVIRPKEKSSAPLPKPPAGKKLRPSFKIMSPKKVFLSGKGKFLSHGSKTPTKVKRNEPQSGTDGKRKLFSEAQPLPQSPVQSQPRSQLPPVSPQPSPQPPHAQPQTLELPPKQPINTEIPQQTYIPHHNNSGQQLGGPHLPSQHYPGAAPQPQYLQQYWEWYNYYHPQNSAAFHNSSQTYHEM